MYNRNFQQPITGKLWFSQYFSYQVLIEHPYFEQNLIYSIQYFKNYYGLVYQRESNTPGRFNQILKSFLTNPSIENLQIFSQEVQKKLKNSSNNQTYFSRLLITLCNSLNVSLNLITGANIEIYGKINQDSILIFLYSENLKDFYMLFPETYTPNLSFYLQYLGLKQSHFCGSSVPGESEILNVQLNFLNDCLYCASLLKPSLVNLNNQPFHDSFSNLVLSGNNNEKGQSRNISTSKTSKKEKNFKIISDEKQDSPDNQLSSPQTKSSFTINSLNQIKICETFPDILDFSLITGKLDIILKGFLLNYKEILNEIRNFGNLDPLLKSFQGAENKKKNFSLADVRQQVIKTIDQISGTSPKVINLLFYLSLNLKKIQNNQLIRIGLNFNARNQFHLILLENDCFLSLTPNLLQNPGAELLEEHAKAENIKKQANLNHSQSFFVFLCGCKFKKSFFHDKPWTEINKILSSCPKHSKKASQIELNLFKKFYYSNINSCCKCLAINFSKIQCNKCNAKFCSDGCSESTPSEKNNQKCFVCDEKIWKNHEKFLKISSDFKTTPPVEAPSRNRTKSPLLKVLETQTRVICPKCNIFRVTDGRICRICIKK